MPLFFLEPHTFIFFFLFPFCPPFFRAILFLLVYLFCLFLAAIFICSFLAKKSKPALFFFGLLLNPVLLREMHRRFWCRFLDCLLMLLKGNSVHRIRCIDWRLGQQYYVFYLFPEGLRICCLGF